MSLKLKETKTQSLDAHARESVVTGIRLRNYYLATIFSVLFAVVGFSYNAWRLEVSEDNYNIRTASFEVLKELAMFEQVLYAAHYDKDLTNGSPRLGWVKIGLIHDLSRLISPEVHQQAKQLRALWQDKWQTLNEDQQSVDLLVKQTDQVRNEINDTLVSLR